MRLTKNKIQSIITNRLKEDFEVVTISPIKRWPEEIVNFDWSLGFDAELTHYFQIETSNLEIIYCKVTTLYDLFILRVRFYIEEQSGYSKVRV